MLLRGILLLALTMTAMAASKSAGEPTFHKDVLPILQKNCQGCHRPGEVAPMSLLTYDETRPWAQALKESVLLKRMPPWFAEPGVGKTISNERLLSPGEIDTIVAWADAGAPAGEKTAAPAPVKFVDGWNIGEPDTVFEMQQDFAVPANGVIDYNYLVIPTGFTEDKWVTAAEVRPGNRAVLHHVIVFVRPPDSEYMIEAKPGEFLVPGTYGEEKKKRNNSRSFLVGFAPGTMPEMLEAGQGKLIPAGSDFVLQLHYTANGKAQSDRTHFGLKFAKQTPTHEVRTLSVGTNKFAIPPGAPDHRVDARLEVPSDMTLTALLPHMHLRGKSFEYRVVFADGRNEVLLRVPKFDFNWQLSYYLEEPLFLPKGTVLEATAHFDNSPNNPSNPDPALEVKYGDQSFEEMMIGFFDASSPVKEKKKSQSDE